jgi:hypothetical protein
MGLLATASKFAGREESLRGGRRSVGLNVGAKSERMGDGCLGWREGSIDGIAWTTRRKRKREDRREERSMKWSCYRNAHGVRRISLNIEHAGSVSSMVLTK